ncbi:Hypothetical predicted protein [Lecanosticta acicola]|uniref:AB hydrolase-1 domain-containing protein n=1 Tax=Lecanosticta acicola TaxID=111012 RepID=A0AAI8Z4V1_9PEZI|nr:Hypothetical predicted protein [Lecanosticta acicola]
MLSKMAAESEGQGVETDRTYFYVGGHYVNATLPSSNTTSQYMTGQIYVEHLVPELHLSQATRAPIVFITGNGQSGTNFLNTPDGREGWASYFLRQGHPVYITDMAQRGRSPYIPGGETFTAFSTGTVESQFTASQDVRPLPYPQASLHTQWPGTGHVGDPIFDAFYASQVPALSNETLQAELNNASYSALVDKIGEPVIVVTHSQSGPFGWQLADSRPHLIRALVAIEPQGPPFQNWAGPPFAAGFSSTGGSRRFGVTNLPLHYEPSIGGDGSELMTETVLAANANVSACTLQVEPAKKLVNIAQVPILMLTAEASYHRVYDHCTVKYLEQAGVGVDYVQLGDVGIHGNSHFAFLEKNNLEIVDQVVRPWMDKFGTTHVTC